MTGEEDLLFIVMDSTVEEFEVDRVTEQPASPKDRILGAASQVFLTMGFEKTSTADIARLAKVSKRELYLNFSDKRALLEAVVHDLQKDMAGRMDDLWASDEVMEDVLLNSATALQRFILSERFGKLIRMVAAESYHSEQIARHFYDTGPVVGRRTTAAYLKKQMKYGRLRTADPLKAADDFLNLVIGAQLLTAVILGQVSAGAPRPSDTRHAVEVFLMIYQPDLPKRTAKPRLQPARAKVDRYLAT